MVFIPNCILCVRNYVVVDLGWTKESVKTSQGKHSLPVWGLPWPVLTDPILLQGVETLSYRIMGHLPSAGTHLTWYPCEQTNTIENIAFPLNSDEQISCLLVSLTAFLDPLLTIYAYEREMECILKPKDSCVPRRTKSKFRSDRRLCSVVIVVVKFIILRKWPTYLEVEK